MTKKNKRTHVARTISTPATAKSAVVYILGDAEMVAEYAAICATHGYAVAFNWNNVPQFSYSLESQTVRKSSRVPADTSFALELTNLDLKKKRENLELLDSSLPSTVAIVSSAVTVSATEQLSWIRHKSRLVGCAALPTLSQKALIEIAPTVHSPKETVQVVQRFFQTIGKDIELVQDRVGMVFPRIICQIVNEAAFALQEEIASPRDIDTAMKIGAEFPLGPIEWADKIGLEHVLSVLSALQSDLAEDRYRVAPLLKQMVDGGTWWNRTQATTNERSSQ